MVDNIQPHYLYSKRGFFYFSRHIPVDLRRHYRVKRLVVALRTTSRNVAVNASRAYSQKLDEYWSTLRISEINIPHLKTINDYARGSHTQVPKLSDALKTYLRLKGHNKSKTFYRGAERNVECVIKVLGDRAINEYASSDAAYFRDYSLDRGLTISSVKRNFSTIRSIINLTISEQGINCTNAFSRIYMPDREEGSKRNPIPLDIIRKIQCLCSQIDDEQRWLIALISDTGMRLSEAAGLHISDIVLDKKIPYIDIKPHPWRQLKTKASCRQVPLVGSSLWAAKRVIQNASYTGFAFPRYTSRTTCNANSASAALNKWLKPRVPNGCVIHSFRHSLRDRLRVIQCPSDIIDEIGGWVSSGVGQQYGDGYSLEVKHEKLKSVIYNEISLYPVDTDVSDISI